MKPAMKDHIVVGTRGSRLALVQTEEVRARLNALETGLSLEVMEIKSTGDREPDAPLERLGKGIFIRELEWALLEGRIDMAVHSLKDLPIELEEGLAIVVVCQRQDPREVLINKANCPLSEMPAGSVIGTSSPRRLAQLRALRDDLRVEPVRGNVETRLRKATGPDYDGVVLAAAGLARLGLQGHVSQYFDPSEFIPEPGQGALAVEVRAEDGELLGLLSRLEDLSTGAAIAAERAFVERLGGGCRVPMAAYGTLEGTTLSIVGMAASEGGGRIVKEQLSVTGGEPVAVGNALAERLLAMGASEILNLDRGA